MRSCKSLACPPAKGKQIINIFQPIESNHEHLQSKVLPNCILHYVHELIDNILAHCEHDGYDLNHFQVQGLRGHNEIRALLD